MRRPSDTSVGTRGTSSHRRIRAPSLLEEAIVTACKEARAQVAMISITNYKTTGDWFYILPAVALLELIVIFLCTVMNKS
jgi:hypothetical protein